MLRNQHPILQILHASNSVQWYRKKVLNPYLHVKKQQLRLEFRIISAWVIMTKKNSFLLNNKLFFFHLVK